MHDPPPQKKGKVKFFESGNATSKYLRWFISNNKLDLDYNKTG